MPTLQDVQRNQAVQGAQQGTYKMDFDPDAVMQEIANKDMQLQMKEQELAMREQSLPQAPTSDDKLMEAAQMLNEAIEQRQMEAAQATEQTAATPIVPMQSEVTPPAPGGGAPQQQADVSESTMANLQPGQEVSVTKKIVMTPNGPQEVGRSEKIKGMQQQQQAQAPQQPQVAQ